MQYSVQFVEFLIETSINLNGKVNAMQRSFAKKLCLCISKINVNV